MFINIREKQYLYTLCEFLLCSIVLKFSYFSEGNSPWKVGGFQRELTSNLLSVLMLNISGCP